MISLKMPLMNTMFDTYFFSVCCCYFNKHIQHVFLFSHYAASEIGVKRMSTTKRSVRVFFKTLLNTTFNKNVKINFRACTYEGFFDWVITIISSYPSKRQIPSLPSNWFTKMSDPIKIIPKGVMYVVKGSSGSRCYKFKQAW